MDDRMRPLIRGMTLSPGATQDDLEQLSRALHCRLPSQYVDFMMYTNGAYGRIGEDGYLELWPVEEIASANEEFKVSEYAPGLVLFGGDGANELYAFDNHDAEMPIVQVPQIVLDRKDAIPRGRTFMEFLQTMADES